MRKKFMLKCQGLFLEEYLFGKFVKWIRMFYFDVKREDRNK